MYVVSLEILRQRGFRQISDFLPSTVIQKSDWVHESLYSDSSRDVEVAEFQISFQPEGINQLLPGNIEVDYYNEDWSKWLGVQFSTSNRFIFSGEKGEITSSNHWGTLLLFPPTQWKLGDKGNQYSKGYNPDLQRGFPDGILKCSPNKGNRELDVSQLTDWICIAIPLGGTYWLDFKTKDFQVTFFKKPLMVRRFYGKKARIYEPLEEIIEERDEREFPYHGRPCVIPKNRYPELSDYSNKIEEIPLNSYRYIRKTRQMDLSVAEIVSQIHLPRDSCIVLQNFYVGFKTHENVGVDVFGRLGYELENPPVDSLIGKDRQIFNALVQAGVKFEIINFAENIRFSLARGKRFHMIYATPYCGVTLSIPDPDSDDDYYVEEENQEFLAITCLIIPNYKPDLREIGEHPREKERRSMKEVCNELRMPIKRELPEDSTLLVQELALIDYSDLSEIYLTETLHPDFIRFKSGRTLFLHALFHNDLKSAEDCLKRGANPNAVDKYGDGARHYATSKGAPRRIHVLDEKELYLWVEQHASTAPMYNSREASPFHGKDLSQLKYLIDHIPPSVAVSTNYFCNTILQDCHDIKDGKPETVECLLGLGIPINNQNVEGNTVLHLVAKHYVSNLPLLKLLVNLGADITLKNQKGELPLDLFPDWIKKDRDDIIQLLTPPE